MEKAHSSQLYEQAINQNKEADSHAHKILSEVSSWFCTSLQANQTKTEALKLNLSENINATSTAFKHGCEALSNGLHTLKAEVKREEPELADFLHVAGHAPEIAAHRIVDFYKTRPLVAALETIIPPVIIVDGIIRGGLPKTKDAQICALRPQDIEKF